VTGAPRIIAIARHARRDAMATLIFWDEDTQHDFMDPDGKLYVPGAETIVPNLERLTRCARTHDVPIVAVMDDHTEADAEISAQPNFHTTFPPHCMRGTHGQERIDATAFGNPLYLESRAYSRGELEARVRAHRGEIVIKKQNLDPFSNSATALILELLDPQLLVVYGVATDFCVDQAIVGLTDRKRRVWWVQDASRPIDAARARQCEAEWRRRGVVFVSTAEVVEAVESGKFSRKSNV
jgi:nicotinamidase/pyrazinamidase